MSEHPEEPDKPLAGGVAVVTGGSRGLGRQIVQAFAEAGADVVIASRKMDSCERAAEEVARSTGARCLPYACHVGHWDELAGLVDSAYDTFGRCDVLVNNAGMSPLYPSLAEVSEELFDKTIGVNFKGPFRLSALAGERMKVAGSGSIINISSIAAIRPTPAELPYAAAKAALNVLTAGFALAYGPEVRVNTIMAGPFLTDVARAWDMEAFERGAQHFPMRRAGNPREIVGAALYLASPAASFTTGAVITVDGGCSITR
ncbi:MAG TPA: glucose 1-dehydrogenase [Acidimicrobiales bacterium]|nr:glucose 1-dehydrogenase [Acidimicrobiales bacterium]